MRRRAFIGGVAGVALTLPFAAAAQISGKRPTIGFLCPATLSGARQRLAPCIERLGELGWVEGGTVNLMYRAEERTEHLAAAASELARLNPDVIATWGTATAVAAKHATATIPIVFTVVGDPVGSGLVASLARPGGNVTGLSSQHDDAAGKRLELLREVVPRLRRLALMVNAGNSGGMLETAAVERIAKSLGIEIATLEIRGPEEIAPAIQSVRGRADALYVVADALFNSERALISRMVLDERLPTMSGFPEIVADGGLMAYAPDFNDLFRRAGDYIDRILRGTKPADLPVEQPTKFELLINARNAAALGLNLPPTLLARADEVIE